MTKKGDAYMTLFQILAAIPATVLLPALAIGLKGTPYEGELIAMFIFFLSGFWYMLFGIVSTRASLQPSWEEAERGIRSKGQSRMEVLLSKSDTARADNGRDNSNSGRVGNASIVAEYFSTSGVGAGTALVSVGNGLGKLLDLSLASNNLWLMALGLINLTIVIIVINRLLWKRAYNRAVFGIQVINLDLISIDGVGYEIGGTTIISSLSFGARKNEFLSIIGPSGCGKSTLLRIIAGLIRPTRGKVLFSGKRITAPRKEISFVFQDFALLPWLTNRENVMLGLSSLPMEDEERDSAAGRMLGEFGLGGFEDSYPNALSGGMKRESGTGEGAGAEARGAAHGRAVQLTGRAHCKRDEKGGSPDAEKAKAVGETGDNGDPQRRGGSTDVGQSGGIVGQTDQAEGSEEHRDRAAEKQEGRGVWQGCRQYIREACQGCDRIENTLAINIWLN